MTLHIQSDASYLSRPNARSVAGAIFYLGNKDQPAHINGAIHVLSTIIPSIVSSVAEAEYAVLFIAGQEVYLSGTLCIHEDTHKDKPSFFVITSARKGLHWTLSNPNLPRA